MRTIWNRVNEALSGLGVRVANNRLVMESDERFPERFFVFQEITASPEEHFDDIETVREHLVQVNCWSRNGFEAFPDVESAMKAAGFVFSAARDLGFDNETGHYGRNMDFLFYEERS